MDVSSIANWLVIVGPGICGVVYAITAIAFVLDKRPSWALTYFAYAVANVGLILASLGSKTAR